MNEDNRDHERVYDEQISPLMAQIIAICKQHSIAFHATFEYATRQYCVTHMQFDSGSLLIRMMGWLINANQGESVNVDLFILALMRYANEHGHSSAYIDTIKRAQEASLK